MGGYRLEDRGEGEDQNIMIVDDHDCEKKILMKRGWFSTGGGRLIMVVVSRVDEDDNDDISNGYDDGDNHFGSKSLDEYDDDHDGSSL